MNYIKRISIISVLASLSIVALPAYSDTTSTILLKSNKNAEFYLDGESVGIGRKVYVTVDPTESHTIIAKPEGYVSKEEYIEPPYYENTSFDFYYMIGDKEI